MLIVNVVVENVPWEPLTGSTVEVSTSFVQKTLVPPEYWYCTLITTFVVHCGMARVYFPSVDGGVKAVRYGCVK